MKEFDMLCKEAESLDVLDYGAILTEKSMKILPALKEIMEDGLTGAAVYATFIIGSVVADGKLSEEEYLLIYPLLHDFFGDEVNYEDCKKAVRKMKPESRELKDAVDEMVDVLGRLSEDLKNDIITVCLLICSIDGKVSAKEKAWIKQLIR